MKKAAKERNKKTQKENREVMEKDVMRFRHVSQYTIPRNGHS